MKKIFAAIGGLFLAAAAPAVAQTTPAPLTFNTVGNDGVNGTYGESKSFDTTTASTLKLKVTAWQANTSTNKITSAYLGAYDKGLGVTGLGDDNGGSELHQIDNNNGYVDFVMLQFNQAVTLKDIAVNGFGIWNTSDGTKKNIFSSMVYDTDWAWYDAAPALGKLTSWDAKVDLASFKAVPGDWTSRTGTQTSTGASASSAVWLVGASFSAGGAGNYDGFKLASVTVTPMATTPVPEPATWAMMLIGFGTLGSAMRRSRRREQAIA